MRIFKLSAYACSLLVLASGSGTGCSSETNLGDEDADTQVDASTGTDASPQNDGMVGTDTGSPDSSMSSDSATDTSAPVVTESFVLVGSGDGKIRAYSVDRATFALTFIDAFTPSGIGSASFIAQDPNGKNFYATEEGAAGVFAFSLDRATKKITFGNRVATDNGPTHLSVDKTGKWVFVAHYGAGTYTTYGITGGVLGAQVDKVNIGEKAHYIGVDESNKYVFVPCLGANNIAQRVLDLGTGKSTANTPANVASANGAGPRHFSMRPDNKFGYAINELNSTMTAYAHDASKGTLTSIQTLSTLAAAKPNTGAEVFVHPSGKFLYGSNRGDNTIVLYTLDAGTGMMTRVSNTPTGGGTPRSFGISRAGTMLVVGNQANSTLGIFSINTSTGALTATAQSPLAGATQPTFVGVFDVP